MRILFSSLHNYLDCESGAAISTRESLLELARRGHEVRTLCGWTFDGCDAGVLFKRLERLKLSYSYDRQVFTCNSKAIAFKILSIDDSGIESTLFLPEQRPDVSLDPRFSSFELDSLYTTLFHEVLRKFSPDLYASYGGYPAAPALVETARRNNVASLFLMHNLAYSERSLLEAFDRVVVPSKFARRHYWKKLTIDPAVCPPLFDRSKLFVKENSRQYLTFVNPAVDKGLYFFTGLALALNERRPDIPLLVIESRERSSVFARIPEASSLRNIRFLPFQEDPRSFLAQSRLILIPSLCEETFGRLIVEAGANAIPALCSARGALPETIGGGPHASSLVLPVPSRFTASSSFLPTSEELEPWVTAIERLWDDPEYYQDLGEQLRRAVGRYVDGSSADETEKLYLQTARLRRDLERRK